ncbi:DUF3696 domain-containing protein [uncultured Chloroflexus sp.]|uniref:AAA family ATPase n=1 Tax=uncultured Chloroflexus sp. TaxID=214040 RepID=UPI0026036052|nr:DUF3696 domain-containing protein [uncultured Chloroflexus sp.]
MITEVAAENFKSWRDTGPIRMAPITGLFGPNSSGKTAILQLLLLLKQTVESSDQQQVLQTGHEHTYVNLGTFFDIIHAHRISSGITISIEWHPIQEVYIPEPDQTSHPQRSIKKLNFSTTIQDLRDSIAVKRFTYSFSIGSHQYQFGMEQEAEQKYNLLIKGYDLKPIHNRSTTFPAPIKCYGFPSEVFASYQNANFLKEFVLAFEKLGQHIWYLGPLREYPKRTYVWSGQRPQDVGQRGELAIAALLAARKSKAEHYSGESLEEKVAQWLKELGLAHHFSIHPFPYPRNEMYEVSVKLTPGSPDVLITDVGFGISQILPVIVLCYYAPKGATIILEQPETHLHPSVQAGLADVLIDAIRTRQIQIILESHSEHLLRRLQRRIAEGTLDSSEAALYFCTTNKLGISRLQPLQLDQYGNITNWPENFFGDEFGDIAAMQEAMLKRQLGSA